MNELPELLTVREVARWYKISTRTVYRYIEDGDLPFFRIGTTYRINRKILEAFAMQNHQDLLTAQQKAERKKKVA